MSRSAILVVVIVDDDDDDDDDKDGSRIIAPNAAESTHKTFRARAAQIEQSKIDNDARRNDERERARCHKLRARDRLQ